MQCPRCKWNTMIPKGMNWYGTYTTVYKCSNCGFMA